MDRSTVTIADFCAALYCAEARPDAFATASTGRISLVARSDDGGDDRYYRAEFDGVWDYQYRGEAPLETWEPGDRLELSVVELDGEPGAWRVWFEPWYLHEIEFRCRRIRLNGGEVVGRGRHLQDGLPAATPVVPPFVPGAA